MESIRLTEATMAQYRKDCQADRYREKKAALAEQKLASALELKHDTSMVGRFVFVPKQALTMKFTKAELNEMASIHEA
jgi:hypothetical protein